MAWHWVRTDALSAHVDGLLAHLGAIDLEKPGIPEDRRHYATQRSASGL